jgi:hypothetical protein
MSDRELDRLRAVSRTCDWIMLALALVVGAALLVIAVTYL